MSEEQIRQLAEEHYKFWERWFHTVYVDAFIHGYKHGKEGETKTK